MSTVGKDDNWMTQKRLNSVFATAQLVIVKAYSLIYQHVMTGLRH